MREGFRSVLHERLAVFFQSAIFERDGVFLYNQSSLSMRFKPEGWVEHSNIQQENEGC